MGWSSFVAVGDSFTEGMDDVLATGEFRGWADLVAARLAAESPLDYANLAIRGKLFDVIVEDQVPVTLRMRPDLVSFAAGGNDLLRRKVDMPHMVERFDSVVQMLRASGADVLLFQFADFGSRMPGSKLLRGRIAYMNDAVRTVAEKHGAFLVEMNSDVALGDSRLWSADRLHLNAAGHRRVAGHVLRTLGVSCELGWMTDLPPAADVSWASRRWSDVVWAREYAIPWIHRRLTRRSSGDGRAPKRPELTRVDG